jgi:hypothetical protein
MLMRLALFWDITQHRAIILYQRKDGTLIKAIINDRTIKYVTNLLSEDLAENSADMGH